MNKNVTVAPGKEKKQAVNLELPCGAGPRKFKFHITQGNNTTWENKHVMVPVEKKVMVKIK